MRERVKQYPNGWTVIMSGAARGNWYVVTVRNARGDVHDKMRSDEYSAACEYWRAFNKIAKAA